MLRRGFIALVGGAEDRVYGRPAGRTPDLCTDWVASSCDGDESLIHFQLDYE